MNVPQAVPPFPAFRIGIEGMHVGCELFFIEQVDQLGAVKLDRVD
jgi:hypothetical protein